MGTVIPGARVGGFYRFGNNSLNIATSVTRPLLALLILALALPASAAGAERAPFDSFLDQVQAGRVKGVVFAAERRSAEVTLRDGREYRVGIPPDYGSRVVERLLAANAAVDVEARGGSGLLLYYLILALIYGAFWVWLARRLTRIERALSPSQAA